MKPPKIEFPCDYPIKVIGDAHPYFVEEILTVMQHYDATVARDKVKERASRNGNYHSVTVLFRATGEPQLKRLFEDLKECESVRMVL